MEERDGGRKGMWREGTVVGWQREGMVEEREGMVEERDCGGKGWLREGNVEGRDGGVIVCAKGWWRGGKGWWRGGKGW